MIHGTPLKQSILVANVKPLTWNDSNVTFNHIQHKHAWTGLLLSASEGLFYCAVVWVLISVKSVNTAPVINWISVLNEKSQITVTRCLYDGFDAVCNDLPGFVFNTVLIFFGKLLFTTILE